MRVMKSAGLQKLVYFAGIGSFTFFFILALCWRNLLGAFIEAQMQLNPLSILYKIWVKNQVPIRLEIYLFNLTNAEELKRDKAAAPNFAEIGPFLFEETREKSDIFWTDSEQTVTFNQTKKWRILPELSENFSTKVTNFNPLASVIYFDTLLQGMPHHINTIAYISRLWKSKLQRKIANALLNAHEPLFVTATAQEWTFDGIPDDFLSILETLRKVTDIPIPFNKFGWFYDRNGSSSFDGSFTMKTGASSIREVGMMIAWNHKNRTEHYEDSCALVYGYAGEVIPPLKPPLENLPLFASDICSYITLKYRGSVSFEGLEAYEYIGDESVFDNGTLHPENWCFYLGESIPSGLRNVSGCRFGSPAFISFPHFYLADAYYTEKLTGMKPDEKKHRFTLTMEPNIGVPLAVEASFQINFLVEPYEWCDEFRELPKRYIPMLWFKQTVRMPNDYSNVLKVILFLHRNGGFMFSVYSFFIFFCIATFMFWRKTDRGSS